MAEKNALIIFIKNPILGKAKTRIAATEGDEQALQIYEQLLAYTRQLVLQCNCERFLYYTFFVDENDAWLPQYFTKKMQISGNLGQRMQAAFEDCFAQGAQKVAIIGSDCPLLTPTHIQQAFEALDKNHFVIGPAQDGGYYLIGMKNPHYFVFENKAWSTSGLLKHTLLEIEQKQMSVQLLETLYDIDNINDYERWKNEHS